MIHHRIRKLKYILIAAAILAIYLYTSESGILDNYLGPAQLQESILSVGIWGPLIIIALQIFQTILSIIPSQITTIAAGFAFGPIEGLFYSLIGAFIGSSVIFYISRKYGKKIVSKIFSKREIVHFNSFFKQRKYFALFLGRVTPIFPNDLISVGAGLTNMSYWHFTIVSTIGFVFQMMLLTLFGSELSKGIVSTWLIFVTIIVGFFFIILIFKEQIKKIFIKDLHIAEKEIEREFRKI
tara:strand:- start:24054 stop:24770 length:717 start_codon:yes stop_codon:yes gene_type:complete